MTHAKWVSGRPDRDTSRIIAPQIVGPSVVLRPGNGVAPKPHIKLFAVHRHDEFDRIVGRCARRQHRAARLQVAPPQRAVDVVENENHALLGSFDPHLQEAHN
jgi:hypothetical protein